jgi:DNA (cytosine-5)-methyltransferase 1
LSRRYRTVSLFSGAGGFDNGFLSTGRYDLLVANDIKNSMVRTYSVNFKAEKVDSIQSNAFPQVVLNDISTLNFKLLEDFDVDVIMGGPPCQDFSVLRSSTTERSGIMVKRGRLYGHFVRALVDLQPKAFVFENVPGLVTANQGVAYNAIVKDFSSLNLRWGEVKKAIGSNNLRKSEIKGYTIIFNDVVNASDFGVPQARRRLLIVGLRTDLTGKHDPLMLSLKFDKYLRRKGVFVKYPLTTIETLEGTTIPNLQDEYVRTMKEYEGIWNEVKTPQAYEWKRRIWDNLKFDAVEDYLKMNNILDSRPHELKEAFDSHETLLKELGYFGSRITELKQTDSSNDSVKERSEIIEKMRMIPPSENYSFSAGSPYELRRGGVSQIHRRIHQLKPSYTVVAFGGGGMAMYHYRRSRSALTNREKARLQTFPDVFAFTGSYSSMKAQIGEAVPSLLAKRFANALAQTLDDFE